MKLSEQQLKHYRDNGYVIVENLVDESARREIIASASRICAAAPYAENTKMVHWDMKIRRGEVTLPDQDRELGVFKLSDMQHHDAYFLDYLRRAPELSCIEQIVGSPDLTCIAMQLVMKPPRHGQWQPYHQDSYYFPVEPQEICAAWLALDEATVENGCLWVIPSRHKGAVANHIEPTGVKNLNPAFLEAEGLEKDKGIPAPMKSGSVIFFHSRLPHMSGPNTTAFRRRGLVIHYANSAWKWTSKGEPRYAIAKGRAHEEGLQRKAVAVVA
jgi:phytanoyl-CoA hydroxylase